jgi:hypothetical protein
MMTTQRSKLTPPETPKTLEQLHALMPTGPVHVVPLGSSGPWQIQAARVVLATCSSREVAEYLTRLWNLMPTSAWDQSVVHAPPESRGALPPADSSPLRRRKAGKTVQVVP